MRYFKCPDGQTQSIKKCLNGECLHGERCKPLPFLMVAGEVREKNPNTFSTTQLLNGTMENYLLSKGEDVIIDPEDRAFAILGTSSHSKLEAKHGDVLDSETALSITKDGITITGILDLVERQPDGKIILIDHKTSGSYKTALSIGVTKFPVPTGEYYKSGAKKGQEKTVNEYRIIPENSEVFDWKMQTNLYRIMWEEKTKLTVSKVKIFNIIRDGGTIAARSRGILTNTMMINIPIVDDEVVLDYFFTKASQLKYAIDTDTPPSKCTPHERWDDRKCEKYCLVAKYCPHGKNLIKTQETE